MKVFVKVCKAMSDASRVKIVKMLQYKVMCVCELTHALGLAQPTVSKHLKILEQAGFVNSTRNERWVNYSLSDGSDNPYVASFLGKIKCWMEDDPDMASLIRRLPEIRREEIC
jgi:ArsR family transcriptional regulator